MPLFLIDMILLHTHRLQHGVKQNFKMHWGAKKYLTQFIAIFILMWWSGTKSAISLSYAFILTVVTIKVTIISLYSSKIFK